MGISKKNISDKNLVQKVSNTNNLSSGFRKKLSSPNKLTSQQASQCINDLYDKYLGTPSKRLSRARYLQARGAFHTMEEVYKGHPDLIARGIPNKKSSFERS